MVGDLIMNNVTNDVLTLKALSESKNNTAQLEQIAKKIKIMKNTIVLIGDSITLRNGYGSEKITDISSSNWLYDGEGWFSWGNVMLRHRLNMLANLGIGGETSAQILARISSVVAYNPNYCHILVGANDIGSGIDSSITIANIKAMAEYFLNNDIVPIIGTIPPRNTLTTQQKANTFTINNWIKNYAYNQNGVICVDYYAYVAKAVDGLAKTGLLIDGTHQNGKGAYFMGYAFYEALKDKIPEYPQLPYSNIDTNNLIPNPMFTGDSSGLATSWVKTGTLTASKIASSDLLDSEWQNLNLSSVNDSSILVEASGYSVGDIVYGVVEFEASNITSFRRLFLRIYATTSAFANLCNGYDLWIRDANIITFTDITSLKGILMTPNIIIPATTGKLYLRIYGELTGDLKVRRAGLYKKI